MSPASATCMSRKDAVVTVVNTVTRALCQRGRYHKDVNRAGSGKGRRAALATGEQEVAAPSAVAPPAPSQPSAPSENKLDGLLKQLEHRADALREPLRAMDEAATKALERGREGIVRGLSELSMRLRPEERTLRDGAGP